MSLAEYEAQAASWGMTDPRYLDAAGKSRLETTAKIGANQYYVYPYGVLPHKGFLYAQLQAAEYTGKNLDEGTQWYYFHARHYDSGHGRFIGHDLVAPDLNNPLTLNPFLYCLNNPGRWVDPDGRVPIETGLDLASIGFSGYQMYKDPSWSNLGWLGLDIAASAIPYMPGSYAFKGANAGKNALTSGGHVAALSAPKIAGLLEAPRLNSIKNIGKIDDLAKLDRTQTLLDSLPNLGSPKANWYQNSSVLRKAMRDGYQIRDASAYRSNLSLDPTLLRPNRTIGQSFLGAERLLMENKGFFLDLGELYVPRF